MPKKNKGKRDSAGESTAIVRRAATSKIAKLRAPATGGAAMEPRQAALFRTVCKHVGKSHEEVFDEMLELYVRNRTNLVIDYAEDDDQPTQHHPHPHLAISDASGRAGDASCDDPMIDYRARGILA